MKDLGFREEVIGQLYDPLPPEVVLLTASSALSTASAPGIMNLSRLNGWPMHSPTDASPVPSQAPAHASGPMRVATPSRKGLSPSTPCRFHRRTERISFYSFLAPSLPIFPTGVAC